MSARWWRIAEAAGYVDVTERTIRRWVTEGRLTYQDRSDATYIDLDELEELASRRGPGGRLPKTPSVERAARRS